MDYTIREIRKSILNLKSNSPLGFKIDIPEGGTIVFHRKGDKIIIRNYNNPNYGMLHFDRKNLTRASTEKENDYLFGIFLENLRKNALSVIGL